MSLAVVANFQVSEDFGASATTSELIVVSASLLKASAPGAIAEQAVEDKHDVDTDPARLMAGLQVSETSPQRGLQTAGTELIVVGDMTTEGRKSVPTSDKPILAKGGGAGNLAERGTRTFTKTSRSSKKRSAQGQLAKHRRILAVVRDENAPPKYADRGAPKGSKAKSETLERDGRVTAAEEHAITLRTELASAKAQALVLSQENARLLVLLDEERDAHAAARLRLQESQHQAASASANAEELEGELVAALERADTLARRVCVLYAQNMFTRGELSDKRKALQALKVHFRVVQVATGQPDAFPLGIGAEDDESVF